MSALDAVKSVCAVIDLRRTGAPNAPPHAMAKERGLCRMIVINHMDDPEADLEKCLRELQETWGPGVLPINLPTRNRTHVIDCLTAKTATATS